MSLLNGAGLLVFMDYKDVAPDGAGGKADFWISAENCWL
jgi:hypothetical protein